MPVIDEKTRRVIKAVNDKKHYQQLAERLEKANKILMGEIASIKEENDALKERLRRTRRNLYGFSKKSIDRAKQLKAIQMILDGEFVLDTSCHKSPELIKSIFGSRKIDHI